MFAKKKEHAGWDMVVMQWDKSLNNEAMCNGITHYTERHGELCVDLVLVSEFAETMETCGAGEERGLVKKDLRSNMTKAFNQS